jgi:phosphodiester glycosidase
MHSSAVDIGNSLEGVPHLMLPWRGQVLGLLLSLCFSAVTSSAATNDLVRPDHHFQYTNHVIDDVPWSIHIVKLDRFHPGFEFATTLGKGDVFGMSTVSEQVKTLGLEAKQPLAAINGDFYDKSEKYPGRPRDVQVRMGEVVSSPAGHTVFWVDPDGDPHMTNVFSRFRVIWRDGKTTPLGLNQERQEETAVLYTSAVGVSTGTSGGTDLFLERSTNSVWLPLRIGQTYGCRVREVRSSGGAPLNNDIMVLSVGSKLLQRLPLLQAGSILQIVTETSPDLSGASIAIGGGPALVHNSKAMQWSGFLPMRHPRTAIGWSKDHYFLVEVDGRQSNISVGMTFPELADYLVKLGCEEAMNFDGGGSSTLWALGMVRNSPSEGDERPSANALVVIRKKNPD